MKLVQSQKIILVLNLLGLFVPTLALSSEPDWKMVSPYVPAGHVRVAVHPKNPDIVYCGGDMLGLYKSIDRGRHWVPIGNDDGSTMAPYAGISKNLVIQKDNPETLFVGSVCRIGKSINGGQSWSMKAIKNTTGIPTPGSIAPLVIDPLNSQYLFAGSGNTGKGASINGSRLIFKSTDNGETWTAYIVFPEATVVHSIILDTTYSGNLSDRTMRIYMSTDHGLWVSLDGGETWNRKTTSGLPHEFLRVLVLVPGTGGSEPTRLFLLVQPDSDHQGGVYLSIDEGKTWVAKNNGLHPELKYTLGEMIYGNIPGTLYVSLALNGFWNTSYHPDCPVEWRKNYSYLLKTINWGESWFPVMDDPKTEYLNTGFQGYAAPFELAVAPSDPSVIYSFGESPAVSSDAGATWYVIGPEDIDHTHPWTWVKATGLSVGCVNDVQIAANGKVHYLDADTGYYFSDNPEEKWNTPKGGVGISISSGDPGAVYIDPDDPRIVYITTGISSYYAANSLRLIPGAIYKSSTVWSDYGVWFTEISKDDPALGPPHSLSTLALGPGTPASRMILAAPMLETGFSMYRSDNAGASWRKLAPTGLPTENANVYITRLLLHPTDSNRILCVVGPRDIIKGIYNTDNLLNDCGVYQSTDGGSNWSYVFRKKLIFDLKASPDSFDTQFMAIFPCPSLGERGGIYKTTDNFKTIIPAPTDDLKGGYWYALAINKNNPNLVYAAVGPVAGTEPSKHAGIFRSTDGGNTWALWNKGFVGYKPVRLSIDYKNNYVYAATAGCGIWRAYDSQGVLCGDASGDGSITAYDAALTTMIALGMNVSGLGLPADYRARADVDGVAGVSLLDAALIAQRAVGLIVCFPAEG